MQDLIIVLSYFRDLTARYVVEALTRRQIPALLLDAGDFPLHVRLDASFTADQWEGSLVYQEQSYDLQRIKSVLYRRPTHYQVSQHLPEQVQAFAENEAHKGFGGILRSLDCFWVSHFDALHAAGFKPRQLQAASRLGLRVPRTLITNDPEAVRSFYEECHGSLICKTLHGGNIGVVPGETWDAIYTSLVTPESLAYLDERVPLTATFFQEYIVKALELRITVVGKRVFAAAIYSQHAEAARVDFRASYPDLRYEVYALPSELERACIALVQGFGLRYGAIDMAITPEGEYVLFELNPAGQYQWIEYYTHLPITEALVDLLVQGHPDE